MPPATASRRGALGCAVTLAILLTAALGGCATPPTNPTERAQFDANNDPLEPLNRTTFAVNQLIDRLVLKPAARVYVTILPEFGRDAIHRALLNLKEPVVVINDVLQGELHRAGVSIGRFAVNSTVGIGGLLDVASQWGLKQQTGDFGQTLYSWGLPSGPYLILPVLGPSNPRDAIGMGVDAYLDPFSYLATRENMDDLEITRFVLGGIDERSRVLDELDTLEKSSLDFYAQLRSLVQQHRAAELRHGAPATPGKGFYNVPNGNQPSGAAPAPPSSNFYSDPGQAQAPAVKSAAPAVSRSARP